ncbi:MAG TPA: DUF4917 family protein [Gammaproteobacteria bacterium]
MLTFDEALHQSNRATHRHVLLGNGFSRACKEDIFAYDALFDRADFASLSGNAKALFEALETTNFEAVIAALRKASKIVEIYVADFPELARTLVADALALREVLVSAIAGSHPDLPGDIPSEAYSACKQFLSNFKRVFTLNYDLLLYWAVMQRELYPDIDPNDGFRTPEYGEAGYVTWEIENSYGQKIYYLHGALHMFDAGSELHKYTWVNTGIRLTEQIRNALEAEKYPMFVAEGTSEEKLDRIKHHAYLTKAFESFARISGALFIFGHSLAENDEHILHLVEKGKISELYIGVFGDPKSQANQRAIERANRMAQYRLGLAARRRIPPPELSVFFYDAESARVWG